MKVLARRCQVLAVAGAVGLSLAAVAGPVSAAPNLTPNGYCGAMNMVQAWGVGSSGGMAHAMAVDNSNGNDGMSGAVSRSACR